MTREQQERIAREILGWSYDDAWNLMPKHTGPLWLWPLETVLMERGWQFWEDELWRGGSETVEETWISRFEPRGAEVHHNTHGEAVNAAALIEIGEI